MRRTRRHIRPGPDGAATQLSRGHSRSRIPYKVDEDSFKRLLGDAHWHICRLAVANCNSRATGNPGEQPGASLNDPAQGDGLWTRAGEGTERRVLGASCGLVEEPLEQRATASAHQAQVVSVVEMLRLEYARPGEQVAVNAESSEQVPGIVQQTFALGRLRARWERCVLPESDTGISQPFPGQGSLRS